MAESRFPDKSRDSSPAAGLAILRLRRLVGDRNRWIRRGGFQDREDARVSASQFSQQWQSGVKVFSDLGFLSRRC